MFELLYARDLFHAKIKTEGSFTNARAMAQLRQYYMRLIDQQDQSNYHAFWDLSRKRYIDQITEEAKNGKAILQAQLEALANKNQRLAEEIEQIEEETEDDFIKEMTSDHSDLTFLSWGEETDKTIILMPEGKNKKKQQM